METLIFVDSNIWCYYFNRSALEHNALLKTKPIQENLNPR